MGYIISTENRPDLAVGLSQKTLGGAAQMLAPLIFPRFRVAERGGTIACAKVVTGNGTKNRSKGTSLTGSRAEAADISYSVAKYEGRSPIDDADIKDHGGPDAAIACAARVAGYQAIKVVEADAAAVVFTSTRYAAAGSISTTAPFAALMAAAKSVKKYGDPTLVCSESWLNAFVSIPAVADVLVDLYGHNIIAGVIAGAEDAMKAVGAAFGVKRILVGDDDFWAVGAGGDTDYSDAAAVIGLRPDDFAVDPVGTLKSLPCYGFSPTFLPEADSTMDTPFEVMTSYDAANKDSYVDATLHAVPKEANAAGAVLVKLPA